MPLRAIERLVRAAGICMHPAISRMVAYLHLHIWHCQWRWAHTDQLRDQRASRGELSPHPAPHGPSGHLRPAGGGPGGPTWSQGHLVRWRASPTGASASSFASSPYKWLAPGRQGVASVQPIGRGRRCKYMPQQRVLHCFPPLSKSHPATVFQILHFTSLPHNLSWREPQERVTALLYLAGYLIPRQLRN